MSPARYEKRKVSSVLVTFLSTGTAYHVNLLDAVGSLPRVCSSAIVFFLSFTAGSARSSISGPLGPPPNLPRSGRDGLAEPAANGRMDGQTARTAGGGMRQREI